MREITLPGTDIVTSSIGFGCAGLMRTSTTKGRQKLLHTAFDSGVKHFDVARMYGLGQAESELGKCIKGRRDKVTITSKFGIELNQSSNTFAPVLNVARYMIKLVPALRKLINKRTSNLYQERNFTAEFARASLEKSLSELQTDYIDCFLLHEPALFHLEESDALEFLEKAKEDGLIRSYGIAGYTQDCLDICQNKPAFTNILQIPNDMLEHQIDLFENEKHGATLTFSPFSNALEKIVCFMKHHADVEKDWSEKLGLDCSDASNVSRILLRYCLNTNSQGVVIFSSSNVNRITQMTNITEQVIDDSVLLNFAQFAQNTIR